MATPTGIILENFDVILEITDDPLENQPQSPNFGGGYVRQMGALVTRCNIDDFVQYNSMNSVVFSQSGVTYTFINQDKIYFIQEPIP